MLACDGLPKGGRLVKVIKQSMRTFYGKDTGTIILHRARLIHNRWQYTGGSYDVNKSDEWEYLK